MAIRADAHIDEFHRDQNWHKGVRVATTANITISTALNNGDTIDGITLATGDRVLVKDQSTGSQNGIYVVDASPFRDYDFLAGNQALSAFVPVRDGSTNGGKVFRCTVLSLPTIGSTSLVFTEFGGGSGSGSVATDTIWDAKGDLAAATGADAAVKVSVGSDGQVLTADSGASAGVSWQTPSSGGTDPTIPSGGTLYDGTSTSGWSNQGSPDTFNANSTIPGAFYLQKTTMGGNNIVTAYRAVGGSFPRTYTMRILDGFMHADFQGINILVGEASPGKYWSWGFVRDGISNKYHQRYAWTSTSASGANQNFNGGVNIANPAQWYRIVVNSSTDIELWHSYNGYIYYRYAAAQNPSFTIGTFGFGMYTFAGIEMKAAIDWIHES